MASRIGPFVAAILILLSIVGGASAVMVAASDADESARAGATYICDGVADEVEINAAFANDSVVDLSAGTFRTSGTVYVKGNSVLRGQGPDKTVLSMAGDYAARVDIAQPGVTVSDLKITNRGWLMITTSDVKVHDVTIQDSKKTAPTVNGMFFVWADGRVCENIEFVRCKAIDVGSTGFNLNGCRSPRVNRNIRFENCLALRCGNAGSGKIWAVGFDFHEGADLYDLYVNNCRAEDCWESGFYFEPNFYNGADPNTAIPVQVNSRVTNCVSANNGWRNTEPTRFYMSGFYLSCGVTLSNCVAINNRKNGFWIWQGAEDVVLKSCIDSGSDYGFQLRTGQRLRLENCFSKSARTYGLYMWGSEGAVITNFQLINPRKSTGCVSIGLREDHPEQWWPVRDSRIELRTTGADQDRLFLYYNGERNHITVNGASIVPEPLLALPTPPTTVPITSVVTTAPVSVTTSPSQERTPPELPGAFLAADYDQGGEGIAYHDTTGGNTGGFYRNEDVDIERSPTIGGPVVAYTRPGEWLDYTVETAKAGVYEVTVIVSSPQDSRSFTLSVDGINFGQFTVPNTGSFDSYAPVKRLVWIGAGQHRLRIESQGYHNMHLVQVYPPGETPETPVVPTTTTTTLTTTPVMTATPLSTVVPGGPLTTVTTPKPTSSPTGTPTAGHFVPGRVEAEQYDAGGEGIGYHDTTPGNSGGYLRQDDVDIRFDDATGSGVITAAETGEWLRYHLDVETPGIYTVTVLAGSTRSGEVIEVLIDGNCMARVPVPVSSTGQCLPATGLIYLQKGHQSMDLRFNGRPEVDAFSITLPGVPSVTTVSTTVISLPTGTVVANPSIQPSPTSVPTVTMTTVSSSPTQTPSPTPTATSTLIITPVPTEVPFTPTSATPTPPPIGTTPTSTVTPVPTLTPVLLPGTVQAENWTEMGPTASSISRISPVGMQETAVSSRIDGAWATYDVNSSSTGIMALVLRVRPVAADGTESGRLRLLIDDIAWAILDVKGDATTFVNKSQLVYVQEGLHKVRLEIGRGVSVDYIAFDPVPASGNERLEPPVIVTDVPLIPADTRLPGEDPSKPDLSPEPEPLETSPLPITNVSVKSIPSPAVEG